MEFFAPCHVASVAQLIKAQIYVDILSDFVRLAICLLSYRRRLLRHWLRLEILLFHHVLISSK